MNKEKRAKNKVIFHTWIDKDLKAQFKEATLDKGGMTKVLVQYMQDYVKAYVEDKTGVD